MKHVVVIGGGVVGLATAWYTAADGHRVTLIDRGAPDGDRCSLGNAGMVVPSHFVPLASPGAIAVGLRSLFDRRSPLRLAPRLDPAYLQWCWRFLRASTAERAARGAPALRDLALWSRRLYESLAERWPGAFALERRGLFSWCRTRHAFHEEAQVAQQARELGLPAEVHDAASAAALEPGVELAIAGAIRYPLDAHLTPQNLVATLVRATREAGVEHRWGREVLGFRRAGARVAAVRTRIAGTGTGLGTGTGNDADADAENEIAGDEFVIAGGVWSMALARTLGLSLPLEAGKGYSFTLTAPPALPQACAVLAESSVAVTPMGSALRVAGTLELAGIDRSLNATRVAAIIEAIPRYLPQFRAEHFAGVKPWAGLRPCSPDGLPYLGRTRHTDNVLIAAGHAMLGITLGAASGRAIADLVSGRAPDVALAPFSPDRYA
jgi:D-amino-acid dehydrogenase